MAIVVSGFEDLNHRVKEVVEMPLKSNTVKSHVSESVSRLCGCR